MKQRLPRRRSLFMVRLTLGVGLVSALSACSEPQGELQQWMESERTQARPRVQTLNVPRKFDPQPYTSAAGTEPFSTQKLVAAIKQEEHQPNSLLASQMQRRKEPLEAVALDNLYMVGSLSRGGKQFGLLKAENLLYQVKVGDHMGQNYGQVTKITETEITLREIVQDTVGEWIERTATIQLQERAPQQEVVR